MEKFSKALVVMFSTSYDYQQIKFCCSDSMTGCHCTRTSFLSAYILTVYTAMHLCCKKVLFYTHEAKQTLYQLPHKAGRSFQQSWAAAPAPCVAFVCSLRKSFVLGFLRPLFQFMLVFNQTFYFYSKCLQIFLQQLEKGGKENRTTKCNK